uniref:Fibronectin type-III domain-containing protein n=1 Tax=Neogobius melanostomus TaxID=47308 RepID=A0A8C6TV29_9GOBI
MFACFVTLLCALGAQALDLHRVNFYSSTAAHSTPEVHCWCSSFPHQTLCSWTDPPQAAPTHYIATYRYRKKQTVTRPGHLIPPGGSLSTLNLTLPPSTQQQWHCHLPDLKLLTDYILNVTAVYPDSHSVHLSTFMIEDIAGPPVALHVSSPDPRTVLVQWEPPSTWTNIDIFPLKYKIMYQWRRDGEIHSQHLPFCERRRVPLRGLSRGRTYQIQVCAQDVLGLGHCSDWSTPVNITVPL